MEDRDPHLATLFAEAAAAAPEATFAGVVVQRTNVARRRRIARRIAIGVLLSLIAVPLQDLVLASALVLAVQLVEMEAGLVAQLLAPINSVGGLLSAVLLTLRASHRRIFRV